MADTISTKRITDLPEDTDVNDNDLFMAGSNGTASLRKKKWSTLLSKIKSKLLANNLTTTAEGYALDARQGKALKDQVDQLNTKIQGSGSIINTYLSTSRSTCKWIRQGDIVTVYFQITASDAIPNEVPIINNFPKPISNVYSAAPSNNTSNPSFAYTINTNGELYRNYGGALNAGETCYGSITYITEDT